MHKLGVIILIVVIILVVIFLVKPELLHFRVALDLSQLKAANTNKGWDPGLNQRRIATLNPGQASYFESCPDTSSGCYPQIPAGGGFYTISPEVGGNNVPCKINTKQNFNVTGQGIVSCPFYFDWGQNTQGKPMAMLRINTFDWLESSTPNVWLGFQENTPYSDLYLGGRNFPNINEAYFEADFTASVIKVNDNNGAKARFIAGVAWYVPALQKSFVLEMNFDNVNAANEPAWSITAEAVDNPACGASVKCLYLGARYWGYGSILGQASHKISLNWAEIAKRLVTDGYLPAGAFGPYVTSAFHMGPEILGRIEVTANISDFLIQSQVTPSPTPTLSSTPTTTPTLAPTPTPTAIMTPTPTPVIAPTPTITLSSTPTKTPTPSPTPTPKPIAYLGPPISSYGLKEGDTISASGTSDPDIYIVNDAGYKRLFLNPAIFNFYGHLGGFANVHNVSAATRDAFPTSGIFRNCETNDPKVYGVETTGEDTGMLHWVNVTGAQAVSQDANFFAKVFCINNNEFNWYAKGSDYSSVNQIPNYVR